MTQPSSSQKLPKAPKSSQKGPKSVIYHLKEKIWQKTGVSPCRVGDIIVY